MKLASHLHRTEKEAKATVSWDEFYRWIAFGEIEGWGRNAESIQLAIVAANLCRAFGGKAKAEDFLRETPEWWSEGETLGEELARVFTR